MFRVLLCLLALVVLPTLTAAPIPPAKPVELIVNGSFEEGPEAESHKALDVDSTEIKGWTVTRGQIDYLMTFCKAADGNRSLDLNGSPGVGGVKQTFKTVKGDKYKVTLSLAVNPNTRVPKKKLAVSAAGQDTTFEFDGTGKTTADPGWTTVTWEFTANDKETTLEIYSLCKDDQFSGPMIDTVSVKAIK